MANCSKRCEYDIIHGQTPVTGALGTDFGSAQPEQMSLSRKREKRAQMRIGFQDPQESTQGCTDGNRTIVSCRHENIGDPVLYAKASAIVRNLYGKDASFRPGQYEAIEATMTQKHTLVVQRTGWGKSLVYFVCTKLMRERRQGVTVVVSPLLVLMENQIEAAEKWGFVHNRGWTSPPEGPKCCS